MTQAGTTTTTDTKSSHNSTINENEMKQIFYNLLQKCRGSRKLVLVIVAIALLLDNMLLTSVVPIIPAFLYELHHEKNLQILNESIRATPPTLSAFKNSNPQRPHESPELIQQIIEKQASQNEVNPDCPCAAGMTPVTSSVAATTTTTTTTTTETPEAQLRHKELMDENVEVGVMFASKPVVQALANPFVGTLTNKVGYTVPMFAGFVIMFLSTLMFAVGNSFSLLFIARSMQGIGSACTSVAGMGMIAERFPDDRERGNAMAIALGGLALGVLIGPPFGGIMYEFIGRASPFLVLAFLALMDGMLQLLVLQPRMLTEEQEATPLLTLIKDPYILIAAGAITFANMGIAILEPALPLFMMDTMNASNWEQGAAFLPASISYAVGTNVFGPLGHKIGRWRAAMLGLIIIGLSLLYVSWNGHFLVTLQLVSFIQIPTVKSFHQLILPNGAIGFAIGMVDSSMMPMLGYLVDIRHNSVYGGVYAIGDVAFCAGFAFGPALSGTIVKWFGFQGLVIVASTICFLFAPLLLLLRNPKALNASQHLINEATVRYVSYTNEETPEEESLDIGGQKVGAPPMLP